VVSVLKLTNTTYTIEITEKRKTIKLMTSIKLERQNLNILSVKLKQTTENIIDIIEIIIDVIDNFFNFVIFLSVKQYLV